MSLVIDISVSRIDYLLTVQAQRTEGRTPDRDVYTYEVSISGPLTARLGEPRLGLRAKCIGTVEHAYSHGALDLTRKVLDLAQAWIDKEGLGTVKVKIEIDVDELRHWAGKHADAGHAGVAHVLYKAAEGIESLTEQALREARETRVPEPLPVVAHKADGETDAERFAAWPSA